MSATYLMVPIRLNALYVKGEELSVVEQGAHFPSLPYFEKTFKEEINCETANISESIVSQPFQNKNLRLGHGIHLHWALPDALTRGDSGLNFPEVPNRWLITRRKNGTVEKQWVVESDYLFPPGINKRGKSVSIPYHSNAWKKLEGAERYTYQPDGYEYKKSELPGEITGNGALLERFFQDPSKETLILDPETMKQDDPFKNILISDEEKATFQRMLNDPLNRSNQPYRYMGRKMPRSAWKESFPGAEYYPSLTATGYGEPTFAAFYPNCFSVFGFHDPDPGSALKNLEYQVVGWYSDESKDALVNFFNGIEQHEFIEKWMSDKEDSVSNKQRGQKLWNYLLSPEVGWLEKAGGHVIVLPATERASNHFSAPFTGLEGIVDEMLSAVKTEKSAKEAIQEKFNWNIADGETGTPDRMLCYAGLNFRPKQQPGTSNQQPAKLSLTVANTPTEALSACLADQILSDNSETDPQPDESEKQCKLKLIEDQLEALQVSFRLDEKKLDTVARFKELRHENGFMAVHGGHTWVIRKESGTAPREVIGQEPLKELSLGIAEALNELNLLQQQYDYAWHEIAAMRKQLFADWYKYMICLYPPDITIHDYPNANLVKYFIESKVIRPLNKKIKATGEIEAVTKDTQGQITGLQVSRPSSPFCLARKIADTIDTLISNIESEERGINTERGTSINYYLEQIPGPRYWQPNNPVVLIEGDAVKATKRHGRDGVLQCHLFKATNGTLFENHNDFTNIIARVAEKLTAGSFGLNTWTQQPWNPFLLEWQTQLFPTESHSNQHLNKGVYSSRFITDNYQAPVLHPDLELKSERGKVNRTGKIYSGNSILTPQANLLLNNRIEDELINKQRLFPDAKSISSSSYSGKDRFDNPIYTLICAYKKLRKIKILAQSLNGFNEALLMHKQTMELHIDDPLGFDEYKAFTSEQVEENMGDETKIAPSPLNAFNPIRAGCLKLLKVRLVDTFGQTRDLSTDHIDTTYKMTSPKSSYLVKLPPRLAQPARLNFRWLNAQRVDDETHTHQATTPICGWLLTNRLDKSVMFYDAAGKALGYFKAGGWREAIDSNEAKEIEDIKNPHLKRVAEFVQQSIIPIAEKNRRDFINDFIGTIDDALDNIQPEKNSGHQGPALLMGRPIAVVRASLNLELCGPPAVNQDWNVFRRDIAKNKRTTDRFTQVQFPVRLGEYGQLNDGLVGYWIEKKDAIGAITFGSERLDDAGNIVSTGATKFYSPQSDYIDSLAIESRFEALEDGPINFYQSIDDAPQTVTLLMDVQGSVHATVGILPNKEISVPQEQYAQALQNIEVSFLHAPLITREGKIELPLRPVSNHAWSWVERNHRIKKQDFISKWEAVFGGSNGEALWTYLWGDSVKWLQRLPAHLGVANVVDRQDRKLATLADDFSGQDALVEGCLPEIWTEWFPENRIEKEVFVTEWNQSSGETSGKDLWVYLLKDSVHWLARVDDDEEGTLDVGRAKIVNKDDRKATTLAGEFSDREKQIESLFDLHSVGIDPVVTDAVFSGQQEMKEGWLKLRKIQHNKKETLSGK